MKACAVLALIVTFLSICGRSACADDVDKELQKLKGKWRVSAMERGDGRNPGDSTGPERLEIAFEAEKLVFRRQRSDTTFRYSLDPSGSPKQIDLTPGGTLGSGTVLVGAGEFGIYKLEGDELWLCLSSLRLKRPDSFDVAEHKDRRLYKFKRPQKPDEATVKEMKKLAGVWAVVSAESYGVVLPEKNFTGIRYAISDGQIAESWVGPRDAMADARTAAVAPHLAGPKTAVFELDVKSDPKGIEVQWWRGGLPGYTNRAIYKLDGDELTICYSAPASKERPTAFETKGKTSMIMYKLKREKSEEKEDKKKEK
jgi:uncharacterized protein (TIGR03067 family)